MSQEDNPNQPTRFPLNHRILGRLPSIFARNIVLQGQGEVVQISFFEPILPPKGEYTPEDVQQMQEVGILAECVARIVMPTSSFLEAVQSMNELVGKMKAGASVAPGEVEDANIHGS